MSGIFDYLPLALRALSRHERIEALAEKARPHIRALEDMIPEARALLGEIAPDWFNALALPVAAFDVRWLQEELNRHGASVQVDGQYGPETHDAVRAYQQANGLTVDGWAGIETCASLYSKTGS